MKKLPLLSVLLSMLALPLAAIAEPSASILISGFEHKRDATGLKSVTTGRPSAIIKEGTDQTTITATEIAYVGTNRLECSGDVTITSVGRTVKAKEITITFNVSPNVYFLNPAGIVISNDGRTTPVTGQPAGTPAAHLPKAVPFAPPSDKGRP